MIVERYRPESRAEWDQFVRSSKNGTFLLERGYMDYHAERFPDHSMLVREPEGSLVAILPAHEDGAGLTSHGGLSYGGFVTGDAMRVPLMLGIFEAVGAYLAALGFGRWVYKTIPTIYHRIPAEEDRYALFLAGADLCRRDVLAVIDRREPPAYQDRRRRAVGKAHKLGLIVREDPDLAGYWEVVRENLSRRHDARPVHSLEEIAALAARFPAGIRLFTCRDGEGELLAGVLIYHSAMVAHAQYIASTETGRRQGALDLLLDDLIQRRFRDTAYFDLGISNESGGRVLNRGLIEQKEGFGARAVVHDHYQIDLSRWEPGRIGGALR
jgi:hypothetical protein